MKRLVRTSDEASAKPSWIKLRDREIGKVMTTRFSFSVFFSSPTVSDGISRPIYFQTALPPVPLSTCKANGTSIASVDGTGMVARRSEEEARKTSCQIQFLGDFSLVMSRGFFPGREIHPTFFSNTRGAVNCNSASQKPLN